MEINQRQKIPCEKRTYFQYLDRAVVRTNNHVGIATNATPFDVNVQSLLFCIRNNNNFEEPHLEPVVPKDILDTKTLVNLVDHEVHA